MSIKYWPILNHWFSNWEAPCKHHLAGRFRAEPPLVLPAGLLPFLSLLGPWDSAHCDQSVRWSRGGKDLPSDHQIWRSGKWITYQWCSYSNFHLQGIFQPAMFDDTREASHDVFFTRHQQRQLSVSQPIYCFGSSKWQMFRYNLRMYICNIYIYTYTYIYIYVYIYIWKNSIQNW